MNSMSQWLRSDERMSSKPPAYPKSYKPSVWSTAKEHTDLQFFLYYSQPRVKTNRPPAYPTSTKRSTWHNNFFFLIIKKMSFSPCDRYPPHASPTCISLHPRPPALPRAERDYSQERSTLHVFPRLASITFLPYPVRCREKKTPRSISYWKNGSRLLATGASRRLLSLSSSPKAGTWNERRLPRNPLIPPRWAVAYTLVHVYNIHPSIYTIYECTCI